MLMVLWGLPPALVLYAVMPCSRSRSSPSSSSGFLYLGALSSFTSIAQLRAPAAVRGRVLSVLLVMLGSLYPLGAIAAGRDRRRDRPARTTAGAAALMLAVLVARPHRRPGFADALEMPKSAAGPAAGEAAPPTELIEEIRTR